MNSKTKLTCNADQCTNPALAKDLRRHVCSLTVLAYRYQRHLPHLLSPGLKKVSDNFLAFGQDIRRDIALLTRRIRELNGAPVSRVEEIEDSSYLPLLIGGRFVLSEVLESQVKAEQRLGKVLGHTVRLAQKIDDLLTFEVAKEVLAKSGARERSLSRMSL